MAKFRPRPGLAQDVARMVAPHVHQIGRDVERAAKRLAPPTKRWITMGDDRVRPTHVAAQGQEVPDNLRFSINTMEWDRRHRGLGAHTYMKEPRDQSSRAVANIKNCRCKAHKIPDGISKNIRTEPPVITGARVVVKVVAEGEHVVTSEVGTIYPGNLVAPGAFFMARAAAYVAARR